MRFHLRSTPLLLAGAAAALVLAAGLPTAGRQPPGGPDLLKQEPHPTANGKPLPNRDDVMRKQREYLAARYDLSGRTDPEVKMSGGRKAVPVGPTAKLPEGVTWEQLGQMSPD